MLTAENFAARLAWANSVAKTDFDKKLKSLSKKVNSNKTKYLIDENESIKKHLNQSIFGVKVLLKMMILKNI